MEMNGKISFLILKFYCIYGRAAETCVQEAQCLHPVGSPPFFPSPVLFPFTFLYNILNHMYTKKEVRLTVLNK